MPTPPKLESIADAETGDPTLVIAAIAALAPPTVGVSGGPHVAGLPPMFAVFGAHVFESPPMFAVLGAHVAGLPPMIVFASMCGVAGPG